MVHIHARRHRHRGSRRRRGVAGPDPCPAARRAGRARLREHARGARVGLTRQKANYHLRALERHGLVELVEERRKGNCTERVLQATAASYVISPTALSAVAPVSVARARPALPRAGRWRSRGAWSARSASSSRRPAPPASRSATLGIDSEVRFASAQDRAAFAAELAEAVNGLVAKYHDEAAPGGRPHRFVVALHPTITKAKEPARVMSREFEITREVDLPASPDDVWTAITAAPAAWMFPTGMEIPAGTAPPEGAPVTTWEPPHRLVVRMEAPDGSVQRARLHHRGARRRHGAPALRPQRDPRRRAGRTSTTRSAATPTSTCTPSASTSSTSTAARSPTWASRRRASTAPRPPARRTRCRPLRAALGLVAGRRRRGRRSTRRWATPASLDGVVDYSTPEFLGVRAADGLFRFFGRNHYGGVVGLSARTCSSTASTPRASEAALKAWLDGVYA